MGFNAILKTKRVYMLYLLPFILAAIAFLRFTFGPEDFSVVVEGHWCVGFAVFVISGIFCCGQI